MWRQVINQTMLDAIGVVSCVTGVKRHGRERIVEDARSWFTSPDFDVVCELADVNARHIRQRAFELMATPVDEIEARLMRVEIRR